MVCCTRLLRMTDVDCRLPTLSVHTECQLGSLLALLPMFPELLLQLRSRVFIASSLLILAYLGPAVWDLWMDLRIRNANFFHAITLLYMWAAWQVTTILCIDTGGF